VVCRRSNVGLKIWPKITGSRGLNADRVAARYRFAKDIYGQASNAWPAR